MRYNHFCLQIDGLDDYVKLIESRGATVTGRKIGNDNSHQAWIKDPDGNLIELQDTPPRAGSSRARISARRERGREPRRTR